MRVKYAELEFLSEIMQPLIQKEGRSATTIGSIGRISFEIYLFAP